MSNQRHARALRTRDVNEVFISQLTEREAQLRSNHRWLVSMLNQMSGGQPIDLKYDPPQHLTLSQQADMIDCASHVGAFRMWAKRGRVTYDLNEYMAAELYRSTSDELPGNIFAHLPHINPLIVLPEPWPVRYKTVEGLVRGFYLYGYVQEPEQMAYTDDDVEGLGLLVVIDLLDPETGEVSDQTYMRMNIPTGRERFTISDAVSFAADRAEAVWGRHDPRAVTKLFESILRPALSILVYLCCDNRDVVEPPAVKPTTRKKRKRSHRESRDPFFVEVGWRMGPRLHAARRSAGRLLDGDGIPSGVRHAPHQKCGHFRRFRVGPGKLAEIIRFVMPYWVRLDLLADDEDPITTVVTVDEQRHDPLRRRGLRNPNSQSSHTRAA